MKIAYLTAAFLLFTIYFSTTNCSHELDRILPSNSFESPYGSLQFALIHTGESTWMARIPFPNSATVISASVNLYSNISWFYNESTPTNTDIPLKCSENDTSQDFLYNSVIGKKCENQIKLMNNDLNYNFIYASSFQSLGFSDTSGGIGLGVNKNLLALTIRPKPKKEIFSIYLSENFQLPSHILFGGVDPNFIENGPTVSVKALSTLNWSFSLNGMKINDGSNYKVLLQKEYTAILDMNTAFIGMPEVELNTLFFEPGSYFKKCEMEETKNAILCDCENADKIQAFTFVLGGVEVSLPASQVLEDLMNICRWKFGCLTTSDEYGKCHQVNKPFEETWVFGGPFLSNFYTTFSFDHNSDQADITFLLAKKEVNLREAYGHMIEEKESKSKNQIAEQIFIALGSFVGLLVFCYTCKMCGGIFVERKNRFYRSSHHELEEEEEEQDES